MISYVWLLTLHLSWILIPHQSTFFNDFLIYLTYTFMGSLDFVTIMCFYIMLRILLWLVDYYTSKILDLIYFHILLEVVVYTNGLICYILIFFRDFTAAIALFTELHVLVNLVSIGTLFVFLMVSNAVIYRRYVSIETPSSWPTLSFLLSFSFTCIMFTLLWWLAPPGKPKGFMLGACSVVALALVQLFNYMVPQARKPDFWGVPLMPWVPCFSIFLNIFLLGNIDSPSYVRFGFFSAVVVLVYVLYSVHASFDGEEEGSLCEKNVEMVKESIDIENLTPKLQSWTLTFFPFNNFVDRDMRSKNRAKFWWASCIVGGFDPLCMTVCSV